jgi:large subunit ribosomal protein L1
LYFLSYNCKFPATYIIWYENYGKRFKKPFSITNLPQNYSDLDLRKDVGGKMEDKVINEAIEQLRKQPKRNFTQSIDLIINLRGFDVRKESLNTFAQLPFPPSEKTICAFLDKPNEIFDACIIKSELDRWNDKKQIKKLARDYDFFVGIPQVMQLVATKFGRVLGPLGKMPSPQLGIITQQDEKSMKDLAGKIKRTARIKAKEPSIKLMIGREDMKNEEIVENIETVYNIVINALPRKKENIKSVLIKLTMGKPVKIEIK